MPDRKDFDATRPLLLANADTVNGHELEQGTTLLVVSEESDRPGELTEDQAALLWTRGDAIYRDRALPTPVESPEAYAARVTLAEEMSDGKVLITAPWMGEGETVAADKADERMAEIIQLGADAHRQLIDEVGPQGAVAALTHTDGFALIEDGSNGYYRITGPGLDPEGESVRGKAKAEARVAELRLAAATDTQVAADTVTTNPGSSEVVVPAGAQSGSPVVDAATGMGTGVKPVDEEGPTGDQSTVQPE
jgi:hypothetical protein